MLIDVAIYHFAFEKFEFLKRTPEHFARSGFSFVSENENDMAAEFADNTSL